MSPQMKLSKFKKNLLFLIRQSKDKKCGSGLRDVRRRFGINFGQPAFRLRAAAGTHGDVLPPIDGIADGGGSDAPTRVEGPKFLPVPSIQREDVAFQIAAKNQVARGGQE